jgi:hypothetical protein
MAYPDRQKPMFFPFALQDRNSFFQLAINKKGAPEGSDLQPFFGNSRV